MKKQFISLMFVIMLASCSSLPDDSRSLSTTPEGGVSQVSSSEVDSAWRNYTNTEVGFSIQYPASWQKQNLPDENEGQRHHIALQGPEGGVELAWGTGFGGACPEGYQPIATAQGDWSACHSQKEDGTDLWSLAARPLGNTNFAGFVYTNDTSAESKAVVLQVVSTLRFP